MSAAIKLNYAPPPAPPPASASCEYDYRLVPLTYCFITPPTTSAQTAAQTAVTTEACDRFPQAAAAKLQNDFRLILPD